MSAPERRLSDRIAIPCAAFSTAALVVTVSDGGPATPWAVAVMVAAALVGALAAARLFTTQT